MVNERDDPAYHVGENRRNVTHMIETFTGNPEHSSYTLCSKGGVPFTEKTHMYTHISAILYPSLLFLAAV